MTTRQLDQPALALKEAIALCKQEHWREGYDILVRLSAQEEGKGALPASFYSFLGVGMARVEGRKRDGVELCRHALSLDKKSPDVHHNLALVYYINGRRVQAIHVIERGLQWSPRNRRLQELKQTIGWRHPSVLPFLHRHNPLNIGLGKVRHRLGRRREEQRRQREEDARLDAIEDSE